MSRHNILSFRPSFETPNIKRPVHGMPHCVFPKYERQGERLNGRFQVLHDYLSQQEVLIQEQQEGIDPDNVLVFEVMDHVENLARAIKRIPGFRFIAEEDLDEADADDDFYILNDKNERVATFPQKLYATLTNRQATDQLLALWRRYLNGEHSKRGEAPFWHLFNQLRNIRYWDNEDRIDTDVLNYLQEDVRRGSTQVAFEIELWFYKKDAEAVIAERRVQHIIEEQGGSVLSSCRYPQICYHALAVTCPETVIRVILEQHSGEILSEHSIKFLKPIGQCLSISGINESENVIDIQPKKGLLHPLPRAAMLDGLPVENHTLLRDYLLVDDPDDYQKNYLSKYRRHGTEMASLIIHGDLNEHNNSISTPLYVRPICKPDEYGDERVPKNVLFPDLLHRAIVDMIREPQCRDIRIINLSLGDSGKMFAHTMSAEAKMLDYLSDTYHLLFLISAGNHLNMVEISDMSAIDFRALSDKERAQILYNQQLKGQSKQRLLAPAESFNNLTIGAIHADMCTQLPTGVADIIPYGYPSLYSAMGLGVGRDVKPSCVLPGGRQVFRSLETAANFRSFEKYSKKGPGLCTANPNSITDISYCIGTSNATALATRVGLEIYDIILNSPQLMIPRELQAVAIKTLFIHSCTWGNIGQNLRVMFADGRRNRIDVLKLMGYGVPDVDRVRDCTDERVVFVGHGTVNAGHHVTFEVPLPPCMAAQAIRKRLTVTLAWSSPLLGANSKYQQVGLYFDSPENCNCIGSRLESDGNASRHGTIQHEIFEGSDATTFLKNAKLVVHVVRKKDNLSTSIPFVLALTLEVAEGVGLPIYQQIIERIQIPAR